MTDYLNIESYWLWIALLSESICRRIFLCSYPFGSASESSSSKALFLSSIDLRFKASSSFCRFNREVIVRMERTTKVIIPSAIKNFFINTKVLFLTKTQFP